MLKKVYIVSILVLLSNSLCFSMSYDNRYFPLLQRPFFKTVEKPSNFMGNAFIFTGDKAFNKHGNDKNSDGTDYSAMEFFGKYDQSTVADAMVEAGILDTSPLGHWSSVGKILWDAQQKVRAQGASFAFDKSLNKNWSFGFSCFVMNLNSDVEFSLSKDADSSFPLQGDRDEIERIRFNMNNLLGIEGEQYGTAGLGDFDFYVQYGLLREYFLKCKKVDMGLRLGLLMPLGTVTNNDCPTSLPFGGNGHWGVYFGTNSEFELKEDLSVGVILRLISRFEKKEERRLPSQGEVPMYAALLGDVKIVPGLTTVVSPYFVFNDIRDGLGLQLRYTFVHHSRDHWADCRVNKSVQTKFSDVEEYSAWSSEYASVNVFYDFSQLEEGATFAPTFSFEWDIPINFLASYQFNKTHRISLGVGFSF